MLQRLFNHLPSRETPLRLRATAFGVCLAGLLLAGCSGGGTAENAGGSGASSEPPTPVSDEGYMETETGLKYRILQPGDDRRPTADDNIIVHYRGKLMDGRVFEESYGRGPSGFPMRGVNEGWREGLQLIGEGGVIELIVPPELGYGNEGTPDGVIPPDATIYFFVELLSVEPPGSSS